MSLKTTEINGILQFGIHLKIIENTLLFMNRYKYLIRRVLYISIESPFKTMDKLKGVFIPLKCYFRWGKNWCPVIWCSKPSKIQIMSRDVGWKDKYNSPRYEYPPYIWIHLFGFNMVWYWDIPDNLKYNTSDCTADYWEQALWYLYYYDNTSYGRLKGPDIYKARESWPWEYADTNESSWNNKFVLCQN